MRAKSRALAVSAGAALVVVPLCGAGAVALTGPEPVLPASEAIALHGEELANSVADAGVPIVANVTATYDIATPQLTVTKDPVIVPRTNRGSTGAVAVSNSADVAQAIAGSSIIAEASKYVGIAYVAGGASPSEGFDCSGFVSYVYAQFGISLPRSSGGYYNVGTRVDSPQPGDIIVTPGHVGIYAGPGLQIDAPRQGKTIQFRGIWQSNPTYVRVTG